MPTVSVVIPTYNHAQFLRRAIESVLEQTYQDFELIVVDDGSTDDTRGVVSAFGPRLTYHYQENQGSPRARNVGIQLAKGKYIAMLDSDDVYLPDRLERGVGLLDRAPEVGLVHGEVRITNLKGDFAPQEAAYAHKLYQRERRKGSDYLSILAGNSMFPSSIMFRRSCIEQVGLFDPQFPPREDYDWYLRFALRFKVALLEEPAVVECRWHERKQSLQYSREAISKVCIAILKKQLFFAEDSLSSQTYRKVRSRILVKIAEYYWSSHSKKDVRASLLEAIRLDPKVILHLSSLKRLLCSLRKSQQESEPDQSVWSRVWSQNFSHQDNLTHIKEERETVRWQKIQNLVRSKYGSFKGLRTIEIGSGRGIYSLLSSLEGSTSTLMDNDELALKRAREFFGDWGVKPSTVLADAFSVPDHLEGQFDLAMSFGFAEHFRYPGRFEIFQSHLRTLKPGGLLIVSVPNTAFLPYSVSKFLLTVMNKWELGLEIPFTRSELQKIGRRLSLQSADVIGSGVVNDTLNYWLIQRLIHLLPFLFKKVIGRQTGRLRDGRHYFNWHPRTFLDDYLGYALMLVGERPAGTCQTAQKTLNRNAVV